MKETQDTGEIDSDIVDNAVAEGGAYEIIRKRLIDQGRRLDEEVNSLNNSRLEEFGSSEMSVMSRVRVRTENNCIARDIVQVGDFLLFGYNVFIGLKKETKIEDVFAPFRFAKSDAGIQLEPVELSTTFLREASFVQDFEELYRYYKNTKLVQLSNRNGKLLAAFQIGDRLEDQRVFRWSISTDGKQVKYIDNRGERDIQLPPAYDFEWIVTTRDDSVHGRHPHINVLDKVFVETVGGDLTIKVENNTEDGLGIYREPVEDKTQSLDDSQIEYAEVGNLILLKIRPYREELWRYFIFNTLTEDVRRVDAIGESCVQLPEDHGIIFPGGYYLCSGEYKAFEDNVEGLRFKRSFRSPNGEDVLFIFYEPNEGVIALFAYNLIEKNLKNPVFGHGYALAENGQLVIFSAESEPTRVHPMQIWETPYFSAEFASRTPSSQSFLGRIGNSELVRGISDVFSVCRMIDNQSVSSRLYEELGAAAKKIFDDHYWISSEELNAVASIVKEVANTAELVIDEFEKVESIRQQSKKSMQEAEQSQEKLVQTLRPENWETAEEYVDALSQIRHQRGHLITIRDSRYIDVARIEELGVELETLETTLSEQTVEFLSDENSLTPYLEKIESLDVQIEQAKTVAEITPIVEVVENTASGMDLLSELMSTLKVQDATVRTAIIDAISQVYARLNQSKASARIKQKEMGSAEAVAQFGAQFKLFSQSIANALSMASTPEKCEEQLSRLLVQLEELESQFSEYDQFLTDIMDKREEMYESFESHKQQLLDERQKKAQSLADAASRILSSIEKRSLKISSSDELNTFFASDALALKVREIIEQLRELESAVKADDLESNYKAIKEQALRALRDKSDIFEDGGKVIKLGPRHKFSVNTQDLDLTIIPRSGELNIHLTGTEYYEKIDRKELGELKDFWNMSLESETNDIYKGEYLASLILDSVNQYDTAFNLDELKASLLDEQKLIELVRNFASPRYKEGYEKGIHDHDAARILKVIIPAIDSADLLRFDPTCRGLAQVFWANQAGENSVSAVDPENLMPISSKTWPERAKSAKQMELLFANSKVTQLLIDEVLLAINSFTTKHPMPVSELDKRCAAEYLVEELGREKTEFIASRYAVELTEQFKLNISDQAWKNFKSSLSKLKGWPAERWKLTCAWLQAFIQEKKLKQYQHYLPEAVALINSETRVERRLSQADLELTVEDLLGDHKLIESQCLSFSLDRFLSKLQKHKEETVPAYRRYLEIRQEIANDEKSKLRLNEFKPRPLSSFVRNRLINESYLPIIGDNLAKQMGTMGEDKRTDLMGLLMMISPPGYGKTTLMEYVASRLGLIFMKINCPSLGHEVVSLDPQQASNATSKQELEKLNLALEMGNNVMLYLDDIQHTDPEFLQKFISLCDGTRRIEGVWKGQTKTYDMRGRKFCVVMAGNPYTESGEAFKIPDMLANRADIYNLGDILGGMDEQFALSYIENALTSNPILAPLAVREMNDVYKLIDMAKGRNVPTTDLSHSYSGAEINEITEVLKKMFVVQEVILNVNKQYISSAAQDDKYRTEPPFKLQGSYRNMNKMTEKISAVMNHEELMQMIADHYVGEAQLLTTGAEANLLKLAELRGNMTEEESSRWAEIKKDFLRNKAMGGDDADIGGRVVAQLADLVGGVQEIGVAASKSFNADKSEPNAVLMVEKSLSKLAESIQNSTPNVEVINQPVPGMDKILTVLANTIEHSIFPLVRSMDKKLEIDLRTHEKMKTISKQLRDLEASVDSVSKPES